MSDVSGIDLNCIGCGACESICPKKCIVVMEVGRRGFIPYVRHDRCIKCSLCVNVCPIPELSTPDDFRRIKKVYRARSRVYEIYLKGASGGFISSLLWSLFEKNLIDGALVVFYDDRLNLFGNFITSKDEVIQHAGAYYQISKQLINLEKIKSFRSVAVIGLPCQIEAIEKYVRIFDLKNIFVTISLFCSIGRLKRGLTDFLKYKYNINLRGLKLTEYVSRYGIYRNGDIIMRLANGFTLKYKYFDYLRFVDYFYTCKGCFACRKLFGLSADLSVGDDWGLKTETKVCLISVNSDRGRRAISHCDILELKGVANPLNTLVKSQKIGVILKIFLPLKLKSLIMNMLWFVGIVNSVPIVGKIVYAFRDFILKLLVIFCRLKL